MIHLKSLMKAPKMFTFLVNLVSRFTKPKAAQVDYETLYALANEVAGMMVEVNNMKAETLSAEDVASLKRLRGY